ncbi:hypothetical protein CLOM_g15098 [Closterium sp. NIES-68]|nr:hypothetical protein CLOM_g15098 [Closterium sp. NIES-68]GJP72745.1 hypothetical protein CLOP_g3495 [Closterium sp. NIES-67]
MAATRRCTRLLSSFLLPSSHRSCLPQRVNSFAARPACLASAASLADRAAAAADSLPCSPAVRSAASARPHRHPALSSSAWSPLASPPRADSIAVADLLGAPQPPAPAAFSTAGRHIDSAPRQPLSADAASATKAEGSDGGRSAAPIAGEGGSDEEDDPILARRAGNRPEERAASAGDGRPPSAEADGRGDTASGVNGGRTQGGRERPPPESVTEHGGPSGPEPTRYGDWEKGGRCSDF